MKHVFLVENYRLGIKEPYSNLMKVSKKYPFSYSSMYKAIKRKKNYRNEDYLISKIDIL